MKKTTTRTKNTTSNDQQSAPKSSRGVKSEMLMLFETVDRLFCFCLPWAVESVGLNQLELPPAVDDKL